MEPSTRPFSKIVVPTDFSSGSERAWDTAVRMAAASGAEIVLVHVAPTSPLDVGKALRAAEADAAERARQAAHQLGVPRRADRDADAAQYEFVGPFSGDAVQDFSDVGREWAAMLEAWADRARRAGCTVRTVLRVGEASREVIATAEAEHADLVLMATHGRGEVSRLLLGSVADKVVRMAPCPVMTLKAA